MIASHHGWTNFTSGTYLSHLQQGVRSLIKLLKYEISYELFPKVDVP